MGDMKKYLVSLPDEKHCYRVTPVSFEDNPGLIFSGISFSHPSQLIQIVNALRCQAIYNTLFCSCLEKVHIEQPVSVNLFDLTASSGNSITVTFFHPVDNAFCTLEFLIKDDASISVAVNLPPGSAMFCSIEKVNRVVNRSVSIPITLRAMFKQSATYIPADLPKTISSKTPSVKSPIKSIAPQRPKLFIPSLSQIQSGLPVMSPQLYSPSSYLSSSTSGGTSTIPLFPFGVPDTPSSGRSKKRGTPTEGGRTPTSKLKLPKITIKRKNDGKEYEIDKEKSSFDDLVERTPPLTSIESAVSLQNDVDSYMAGFAPELNIEKAVQLMSPVMEKLTSENIVSTIGQVDNKKEVQILNSTQTDSFPDNKVIDIDSFIPATTKS